MDQTIPELTKKYIGEKTLTEFASGLGVNVKKQSVSQWSNGIHNPSMEILMTVLYSPQAEGWAKIWASECFAILRRQAMNLSIK